MAVVIAMGDGGVINRLVTSGAGLATSGATTAALAASESLVTSGLVTTVALAASGAAALGTSGATTEALAASAALARSGAVALVTSGAANGELTAVVTKLGKPPQAGDAVEGVDADDGETEGVSSMYVAQKHFATTGFAAFASDDSDATVIATAASASDATGLGDNASKTGTSDQIVRSIALPIALQIGIVDQSRVHSAGTATGSALITASPATALRASQSTSFETVVEDATEAIR